MRLKHGGGEAVELLKGDRDGTCDGYMDGSLMPTQEWLVRSHPVLYFHEDCFCML